MGVFQNARALYELNNKGLHKFNMAHVATESQHENETKSEEDDDEIDVIGIKTEDIQENLKIQEFLSSTSDGLLKNECIQESEVKHSEKNSELQEITSEFAQNEKLEYKNEENIIKSDETEAKQSHAGLKLPQCDVVDLCKEDKKKSTNVNNNDDDNEASCCSATSSASSSRKSSRRNSLNDFETVRSATEDFVTKVSMFDELGTHISDDDDEEIDPYQRFFFESDYLALKDNKQ